MKKHYVFVVLIALFFSCKTEESPVPTCFVNSIEELTWFQDIKAGKSECTFHTGTRITLYTYKSEQVFYIDNGLSSLWVCNQLVYNCAGQNIAASWKEQDWVAFTAFREANAGRLLWTKP